MNTESKLPRASGILAHVTSLPSPYGIGDLGPSTYDFIKFLKRSGQTYWQILPLGPTDPIFDNSPYMTVSAFAGNPLLISPDLLYQSGLLSKQDLNDLPKLNQYSVKFSKVIQLKTKLLSEAFTHFTSAKDTEYEVFLSSTPWLTSYALFMSLKKRFPGKAWYQWEKSISSYRTKTLSDIEKDLSDIIQYYKFEQFIFNRQWQQLHNYTNIHGIEIFGDIPIYVSLDSVDVWANQEIFQLDQKTKRPTHVSGVPPDYFSKTGQKWGNPLYRWNSTDKNVISKLNNWWTQRFKSIFKHVDMARIDHFRGFESYWSVPAKNKTALNGKWQPGPGKKFFEEVNKELGPLKIVAEDLGEITEDVIKLRDDLNFPGMKILQFAFDGNPANSFLPYNFESSHSIIYTGTHDNDTTIGWFLDNRIDDSLRNKIKTFSNRKMQDDHGIHQDLIYLALSSTAAISMFSLQDVLGFGSDCRMNTPGTPKNNWRWRCATKFLTNEKSNWLYEKTMLFGRTGEVTDKNTQSDL